MDRKKNFLFMLFLCAILLLDGSCFVVPEAQAATNRTMTLQENKKKTIHIASKKGYRIRKLSWKLSRKRIVRMQRKSKRLIVTGLQAGKTKATIKIIYRGKRKICKKLIYQIEVKKASEEEKKETAEKYQYNIKTLTSPVNDYFYVETDNPDPTSFRFRDKTSKYANEAASQNEEMPQGYIKAEQISFPDVVYEDETKGRVHGGYIAAANSYVDGGTMILQIKKEVDAQTYRQAEDGNQAVSTDENGYIEHYYLWEDTGKSVELEELYDVPDYLIHTYASTANDFFGKMDAVQQGFDSICQYSGSYLRGALVKKENTFWGMSAKTHVDQSFYIFSPYERKDSKSLFSSVLYPFRYDSLGFPGIMAAVAKRLDSSAVCQRNAYAHYLIDVTCQGRTKSYGGAGNGEGQGLTADKITYYYKFDGSADDAVKNISFPITRDILNQYEKLEVPDDIPREDELTWQTIAEQAGKNGAWIRTEGGYYAFVYLNENQKNYSSFEWGIGYKEYIGGRMGYASNAWVDGRYVNTNEVYEPNAKWEDHATCTILLTNTTVPYIKDKTADFDWDSATGRYQVKYTKVEVGEKTETVPYFYDKQTQTWKTNYYKELSDLLSTGFVTEKELDQNELTLEEAQALNLSQNTASEPAVGYIYDRMTAPGTPFGQ